MRIALLQIRVHARSRGANLAHVLRQVARAAEGVPAPDLLVLPACCDGLNGDEATVAMAQGFGESLAAAAREWGVYVAAGALQPASGGVCQQARLYDPDGDVIAWAPAAPESARGSIFKTALGRVGVALGGDLELVGLPDGECDLLLVLGRWAAPVGQMAQACQGLQLHLAQAARRAKGVVCGVGVLSERGQPGRQFIGGSAVYGPDEQCIVAAQPGTEEIVVAEVTVGCVPASPGLPQR